MAKFTIELPDSFPVVMRNGATVTVETSKLPLHIVEFDTLYGIGQVLRDSASGATKAAEAEGSSGVMAEAQAMMDAKLAAQYNGEVSTRGSGTGTDPRVLIARSIVRKAIKLSVGAKSPAWATFTGLSDADQLAKLDANYDSNRAVFDPAIDAEIKRRADESKAKAKLANAATFEL